MTNYHAIAEACNLGAISGIPAHIKQEFYNILLYYSLEEHTFAQNTKNFSELSFIRVLPAGDGKHRGIVTYIPLMAYSAQVISLFSYH